MRDSYLYGPESCWGVKETPCLPYPAKWKVYPTSYYKENNETANYFHTIEEAELECKYRNLCREHNRFCAIEEDGLTLTDAERLRWKQVRYDIDRINKGEAHGKE